MDTCFRALSANQRAPPDLSPARCKSLAAALSNP